MKKHNSYLLLIVSFCVIVLFSQCQYDLLSGKVVSIENGKIKLEFEKSTGKFISFSDQGNSYEFISRNLVDGLPWEVNFSSSPGDRGSLPQVKPGKFGYSKPDPLTLVLKWEKFEGRKNLSIQAKIRLDEDKAMSYWNIHIAGMQGEQIEKLVFPKIDGIKDLGNEELATSTWMGNLIKEPRVALAESKASVKQMRWSYPGSMCMQLMALYHPGGQGFYASCNDTLSFVKDFSILLDTLNTLEYRLINYPDLNPELQSYQPPYDAVIGSFQGDWVTAAEQYREWAIIQRWCRESRFKKGIRPGWLDSTALWVWNRGKSDNVLKPATELKKRLGLPVNVFWHWWHNCSYDEFFPEYFPPREGKKSFMNAVTTAQKEGVRSIVYMNSFQWGDSSESWKKENAEPYAVRDINGKLRSHVYNIFTGNSLTPMCITTDFWRNKYSSLCDSAVNTYRTNGVYMDQACINLMCYDKSHGHSCGGGNYWVKNFGLLTSQIRAKIAKEKQLVLAGEGSGENWIPYLDAFLTLPVSVERYAGVGRSETIPFFQAVYHEYALTYGSYSSLVSPPYDELWPKEYAPRETEKPLDKDFNKQFMMEQARSFVWGMQPTIANYHSFLASERGQQINYLLEMSKLRHRFLKYLLYGKYCRNPKLEIPAEEIKISKLSIYAGREGKSVTTFKKKVPLLYMGSWKANDHQLGIALASIGDKTLPVDFTVNSADYDLPLKGDVFVTTEKGQVHLTSYTKGIARVQFPVASKGLYMIEIIPSL